jgi:hypothetical protein
VSTSGASHIQIQLGDTGGIETTGYAASGGIAASGTSGSGASTTGFDVDGGNASTSSTSVRHGAIVFTNYGSNIWTGAGNIARTDNGWVAMAAGSKALSDTLDRIRITTVNGTDTFTAGSINIMYE